MEGCVTQIVLHLQPKRSNEIGLKLRVADLRVLVLDAMVSVSSIQVGPQNV